MRLIPLLIISVSKRGFRFLTHNLPFDTRGKPPEAESTFFSFDGEIQGCFGSLKPDVIPPQRVKAHSARSAAVRHDQPPMSCIRQSPFQVIVKGSHRLDEGTTRVAKLLFSPEPAESPMVSHQGASLLAKPVVVLFHKTLHDLRVFPPSQRTLRRHFHWPPTLVQ